jgi:hypothetical protein
MLKYSMPMKLVLKNITHAHTVMLCVVNVFMEMYLEDVLAERVLLGRLMRITNL